MCFVCGDHDDFVFEFVAGDARECGYDVMFVAMRFLLYLVGYTSDLNSGGESIVDCAQNNNVCVSKQQNLCNIYTLFQSHTLNHTISHSLRFVCNKKKHLDFNANYKTAN